MLIEFITKIGKKKTKHILRMGSSNTEDLTYILHQSYYINQTPKGASKMQRIAQVLHNIKKLDKVLNNKGNFRRFKVSIFHEKIRT